MTRPNADSSADDLPAVRWPAQTDYQNALQNPATCFTHSALRRSVPVDYLPFGMARPISGQFANVYQMRLANGGRVAVRLFLNDQLDREARYAAFEAHLAALGNAAPTSLVRFQYQRQGFVVGGVRRPMLLMDWVDGVPLSDFVEKHLHEPARLLALAEQWNALTMSLTAARMAHGDLQHGNILVESAAEDRLRLIDYDGVWVPALSGHPGFETGHPAYRHRDRSLLDFGPEIDRLPALVIYASLRAVASAPDVWYRLHDGDNLLFRQEDLLDPDSGRGFTLLTQTRGLDRDTASLIRELKAVAAGRYG